MSITVAIVEDDASVRKALAGVLWRFHDVKCVGEYASAEEALREVARLVPKVLLMDVNLPVMNGVECVRQLARLAPEIQIIMLTVRGDTEAIFNSLSAGASGYLVKPVRSDELLAAIHDVYAGGAPMTSSIARQVVRTFKQPAPPANPDVALTARENEVLDYLTKGLLYKEIADRLDITYATVRTHVEHIYKKLHVRSRFQAVAKHQFP